MAKILMTWELGGGLGHLTMLKPLVAELIGRGHQVSLALRILDRAHTVFGDLPVAYWQAPFRHPSRDRAQHSPATFTRMLATIGFGDPGVLATNVSAWRSLFAAVGPDLVVLNHSPTALLAAREFDFRRVLLGTGFACPPTQPDLPRLRPAAVDDPAETRQERLALQHAQRLLESRGRPPIERLADLYRDVDDTLLCTFQELDHFGPRPAARYWGCWPGDYGQPFEWPAGSGAKVFAYLKPCAALPEVLRCLAAWRYPTVAYIDPLDAAARARFSSASLELHPHPLDMRQAAAQCDVAILNAGHGALATMLLAGKPAFLIPVFREQWLQAVRAYQQGYAECVDAADAAAVEPKLRLLFASQRYREAAAAVAAKYADFRAPQAVQELMARLEALCGSPRSR